MAEEMMAIFSDRDCYKVRGCLTRLLQRIICIVVELKGVIVKKV